MFPALPANHPRELRCDSRVAHGPAFVAHIKPRAALLHLEIASCFCSIIDVDFVTCLALCRPNCLRSSRSDLQSTSAAQSPSNGSRRATYLELQARNRSRAKTTRARACAQSTRTCYILHSMQVCFATQWRQRFETYSRKARCSSL